MKVTHIIDSGGYYGAEVMLVHLCQAQQKAGLQVEVISIGTRGNYKKPLEEKLEAYGIPYLPWRMLALPDIRESFKILKYCRNGGTDVIHSHGYKGNILLGLIPKRWRKIPVITTVHGYIHQKQFNKMFINQWLDRFYLPKLDAVVLVSEGMRHQVPHGKIGKKLHVIPNGIPDASNGEAYEPISFFKRGDYKITAIGRLSLEKNFQFLISVLKKLLVHLPQSKLVIYGDGSERDNLQNLINQLNLKDHVFLPGYTNNTTQAYRNTDVFVNCSLTEGMPITILEALREGCAIVASSIPANREVLPKNTQYAVISELIEDQFVTALIKLKELPREKSQTLKLFFKDHYTSKTCAERYISLYTEEMLSLERDKNEVA
ncbi:glycosyltransferase [Cellvibrio polysaccharolyticus]|uniref:Glycosyltransferase n=1 Tax=Cellvibrio polysaccharolyticus TaxID=2082724 RepID=A0A928YUF5_9GAMM|nr:glycosyltransferase [Cellvibrio polysaccharolyticus]MBE8716038.1 glycosyltransferase [Cellvibrio polysaccharolyticus]